MLWSEINNQSESVGVVCKLSLWNFEVEGSLTLN